MIEFLVEPDVKNLGAFFNQRFGFCCINHPCTGQIGGGGIEHGCHPFEIVGTRDAQVKVERGAFLQVTHDFLLCCTVNPALSDRKCAQWNRRRGKKYASLIGLSPGLGVFRCRYGDVVTADFQTIKRRFRNAVEHHLREVGTSQTTVIDFTAGHAAQ